MTYPAGTRIIAECTAHIVEGTLVDPVESFDECFKVRCTDGEIVTIKGWLWSVDVDQPDDGLFVSGSYMSWADYLREAYSDPMDDFNYVGSRHHY